MSTLYFEGKVTAQNDDLAYYWLALAMDNVEGDVSTESLAMNDAMWARRETLTKRLSKAQIAKANARVAAWHKAHSAESEY